MQQQTAETMASPTSPMRQKRKIMMTDLKVKIDGVDRCWCESKQGASTHYPLLSVTIVISSPPPSPAIAEVHLAEGQYVH